MFFMLKRPFVEELSRYMTVFRPEPSVWYSWHCVSRLIINGDITSGSKHSSFFLDELAMFANDPLYVRKVCVFYVTWTDLAILVVLFCAVVIAWSFTIKTVLTRLGIFDPTGRALLSKYITWLISKSDQPLLMVATIRTTFANTVLVKTKLPNNHTHPGSAAVRTQSVLTIELVCRKLGIEPYFVQRSNSDIKNNRNGSRSFYWGKDIGVSAAAFRPPRDSAIVMIDVDMYMDMPYMLANHVHTYMISTFQPTSVACDKGEYSFTFDKDDTVNYAVSGGAVYEHPVWNYAGDIFTVSARVWNGLGVRTTVYNVDRKQTDDHHQIICLTPMRTFISPLFDMSYLLGSPKLDRLRIYIDGFLRMKVKKNDCTMVSTAVVGGHAAATISITEDNTVACHAKLGKTDITIAGVRQVLPEISASEASVLVQYHRKNLEYSPDMVFPVEESVNHYQFDPKSYDAESALGVKPFMNPIILGCFAPVKSKSNDQATIQGRILDVKADDNIEITAFDLTLMQEFSERLVPDSVAGTGIPYGVEEVYERQPRPTQRRILDNASMSTHIVVDEEISCFQKSESYGDVKDPRNISTIPKENKLHYSSFMYSFSDTVLKLHAWYAFAMTPIQIAARIAMICATALFAYNTDLSRFDGRVSKYLRTLESMYMMRWVRKDYAADLAELMASQHGQRATTRFGVKFKTGYSRLSGSPETSSFNTVDNAFMAFKALRTTRINGEFMTADQAFAKLGIYGGDDGLTADVDPTSYVKACASVGQKLEIAETQRGEVGVSFLSRLYGAGVWYGSTNSMCDVPRQLAKLHVTTSFPPNVTALQKLHEKMTGFYVADQNTPTIGPYAKLVIEKFGLSKTNYGVAGYFSKYPENNQFPNNDDGEWMTPLVEKLLPTFDFGLFNSWLNKVRAGTASVLEPPLCVPTPSEVAKVKRDAVINGNVIKAEKPVETAVVSEPSTTTAGTGDKVYQCPHMNSNCKFGDKCYHLNVKSKCHGPTCTFKHGKGHCANGISCKRKDCPYDHVKAATPKEKITFVLQDCKNGAACVKDGCKFYHPGRLTNMQSSPLSEATSGSSSVGSGVRA